MENSEIVKLFREIASLLEIKGENLFRIRAYERAAQNIEGMTQNLDSFIENDTLTELPGIGKDLSDRIKEYSSTGKIALLEDLKKSIPEGVLELLDVPSIGPKTAKLLYDQLKINNIADLKEAIREGRLEGLPGIKEKTVLNILKGIDIVKLGQERMTLARANQVSQEFIQELKKSKEVKNISVAGSLRRKKETVRDIDILVVSERSEKVMDAFVKIPLVASIQAKGATKSSVRTKSSVQVDCRVVEEKSFGAALLYFTGSKNFNIKLRQLAIKKDLKLNEYGIFKKDKFICGKTENEMFKALGLAFIEPELREDQGEIELALRNKLPNLITQKDIKGDLHVHSVWSDGVNKIEELAGKAKSLGYSYVAITDHSVSLKIANGLNLSRLKAKKREIDKINNKLNNFKVLFGTEVDIDSAGKIDYNDEILKQFDIVVAAIHTGFKQSRKQLTNRMVLACKNKYVNIIAHPTSRLWGVREAYDIDLDEVFKVASDSNTALEINSFPQRLDLNDLNARRAKERGVRIAIGTDSHEVDQLEGIEYGIAVARRAWLTSKDVINTLSLDKLLKTIKK